MIFYSETALPQAK